MDDTENPPTETPPVDGMGGVFLLTADAEVIPGEPDHDQPEERR